MAELFKLPEQMLVQILSRMPPKSLMRFKCICNSWYALIDNPKFVDKHLSVSKNNKHSSSTNIVFKRYALRDMNTDKTDMVVSLLNISHDDIDDDDDDHALHSIMDLRVPSSMRLKRKNIFFGIEAIELSCHCDGIICLTDFGENIVLCNPSIKEFKLLPVSNLLLSSPFYRDGSVNPTVAVGFGYDFKSRSYKVVRIMTYGGYVIDDRYIFRPPKAEVYSLDTNSWKQIKTASLVKKSVIVWPDYKPQAADATYCNGVIFWSAVEREKETSAAYTDDEDDEPQECQITERIILFHTSDETFHVISLPDNCTLCRRLVGRLDCGMNPFLFVLVVGARMIP